MINKIYAMYFSGTGTTKKIVEAVARSIHEELENRGSDIYKGNEASVIDFTPPAARDREYRFEEEDVVVFGVPTIAGRVPNVLLPFLETLEGGGAIAIPIVLYGNRNYDDSLIELRDILEIQNFHTIAAAAFIGEHSFSRKLAAGRPDREDMEDAERFAGYAADKIESISVAVDKIGNTFDNIQVLKDMGNGSVRDGLLSRMSPIPVKGETPIRPYYKPRDRQGNHINILKVKPKLKEELCDGCGICVEACPMGSISREAPGIVEGICIKCCGCEKKCPRGAIYFDDPGYLYHKEELELGYPERKEPELFL